MGRIQRLHKILHVAAAAFHRRVGKFPALFVGMAGLAVQQSMHAQQREVGFAVHLKHIPPVIPVFGRMAIFAAHTELGFMNIGMAIGTGHRRMLKYKRLMTGPAFRSGVPADKRESGAVVIKFNLLQIYPPAIRSVAKFTIQFKIIAMGHRGFFLCRQIRRQN